jgi:hypothetical protein
MGGRFSVEQVAEIRGIRTSWLNQIEIWFSILARKVIRRGNFSSQADLKAKMEAFIDYFNRTMAKPFKWTYQGKPLTA